MLFKKSESGVEDARRKQMGAATATAEAVLEQYGKLQADRARLLDLIETAGRRLGPLESEKQRLLVRIADGDRSASSRADHLDEQKIQCEREIGGLKIKLAEVEGALVSLNEPRRAIYEKTANEARAKRFAEAKKFVEDHVWNLQARYRTLCRERAELSTELLRIATDPTLEQAQRSQLLTIAVAGQHSLVALHLNERWSHPGGPLAQLSLSIVPMRPPDEKKPLEILK
jgi:chromosome segregation ATPase